MSEQSALLGEPPQNTNDRLVMRGLELIKGSTINPNKSEPYGEPRPPGYVFTSWSTSMVVGVSFGIIFVVFFTTARLIVRRFYTRKLGADDLMIVPGALGCIAYLSSVIVQCTDGCLGKHIWDCTYNEMGYFYTWETVNDPLFFFTVFSVKLSIALQNRRLTLMAGKHWQIIHWIFIITFAISLPVLTIINMVQCIPININYSLQAIALLPDVQSIRCVNKTSLSYAGRAIHIATDVLLLCVPIIIIARLQMQRKKKYRLLCIFLIGGMSVIAGIIRNTNFSKSTNDVTFQSQILYIWNVIDLVFGSVVANLPALNVLVDVTYDKMTTYYYSSRTRRASESVGSGTHGSRFLTQNLGDRKKRRNPDDSILMTGISDEITLTQSAQETDSVDQHGDIEALPNKK
jgi:hypothetical protein